MIDEPNLYNWNRNIYAMEILLEFIDTINGNIPGPFMNNSNQIYREINDLNMPYCILLYLVEDMNPMN